MRNILRGTAQPCVKGQSILGTTNDWINPAAVVGLPLQKTFSAAWVEPFVRRLRGVWMDDFYEEDRRREHAKRKQLRDAAIMPPNRSALGDLPPSVDRHTLAGQLYGGDSAASDLLFDDYDDEFDW